MLQRTAKKQGDTVSTTETTRPTTQQKDPAEVDFAEVYGDNLAKVWRFVRARIPDHAEAHDVTSDVFVRAWRAWDRFDPSRGPVEPWLFTIASRTVTDWWRRRRPEPVDARFAGELDDASHGPEALVLRDEMLRQLTQAMAQLTDREREGLALRFAARLSSEHVARVLGTSPSAAKQMLHRAIHKLRSGGLEARRPDAAEALDLESVIDDVLDRGHVAMRRSELHELLVHMTALHDVPVPGDLPGRVAECVACEASGDGEPPARASGPTENRRFRSVAAVGGGLAGFVAWVPVCLACVLPGARTLLLATGLAGASFWVHVAGTVLTPVIAWLVWRGSRRHGNPLGYRIAVAGAAVMVVHQLRHDALTDYLGIVLISLGTIVHTVHLQRWRRREKAAFRAAVSAT